MSKEKKCAFFSRTNKGIKKFNMMLSESLGVETKIEYFMGGYVIYVPSEKYFDSLIEGTRIANDNKFEIDWVSPYGNFRPLNYISIMYCILPKNRQGSQSWEILSGSRNCCPIDIKEYILN